ncbi:hypothetical protein BDN70DRAFT_873039 [Pholiota conissans]|uniref:GST N-terminal domain-containing protein n=1 Tax=Pholiota conissans TaxID=109636 RepID=A0A9P5ZAM9_9AGAR|nr:hypothetical protein BDN70DRAFT_873039 [Pholiota conissans]
MSTTSVIIYRYDSSPFSHKIDNILALKRIPYERVQVSPMLPRPEITDLLGLHYRRIPILAIGNDVYCDTSVITTALERRFPTSQGYGTVFPKAKHGGSTDTGLIKAFAKSYAETVLFGPAANLIPWEAIPEAFVKDRSALIGGALNVHAMAANRPIAESTISSHLALLEAQLSDDREWLFETELPSLADISVHFVLAWARSFPGTQTLFDKNQNPCTIQWLDRLTQFLKTKKDSQGAPSTLSGKAAADKIFASTYESYERVGFDETEASRLGVSAGEMVQIAPEDTGRGYPTTGKLVALSREEFILEITSPTGIIRCHFPRIGYFVKPTTAKL